MKKGQSLFAVLVFGVVVVCLVASAWSQIPVKKKYMIMPKNISVGINPYNLGVNCNLAIHWDGVPSAKYRIVWLEICTADKSTCGGGYTVKN